jgi:chromosome partitioning protein
MPAFLHFRKSAILHACNSGHLHMRTIAIAVNKGGVGKTTIAKHLAAAASAAGLNTMIFDMDTQQNATSWGKRRAAHEPLPVVRFVTEVDLPDALETARAAGCDLAVIDTPPGRSSEAPAAVEAADMTLAPFWLESDAFEGVSRVAGLARRLGKPLVGVLNFATPNSRSHEQSAREVMEALGVAMAPVALHRYEVYRLANPKGLAVQELEPESRAAVEIADLWAWLGAQLQIGTSALVHNGGEAA